jgi:hypothetical protein
MSGTTAVVIVACLTILVLAAVLIRLLDKIDAERDEWTKERRFLTDRAIARHVGEIVALDKSDERREHGPQPPREHVPTLPAGL